ncbi:hypothetical protein DM02DRAFT_694119 [Periconia macrospinosa]|uniref:N-acetyltransferase domain-containing protein n=1 Tax=Periconia macrospinosa TaxID=97972 RepID=A0A2V1D7M9_9PLEO|nr:hypothetical protein DM02DRAFT_694119 [Periconia macrospinosa]
MAYQIELVEDDDFSYIVPGLFEAMGNDYEFMNVLYPGHHTPAGQSKIASRFCALKNASAKGKWLKAVEIATGKIVGFAMWTVIDEEKPPEKELDGPPGTWPSEEEKRYCRELHRALLVDRRREIRENDLPIMMLNMMAVFPQYQRRGIGKLLMDWGLDLADKMQALCILEGTLPGKRLYLKGGFIVQRDFYLDAGEEFAGRPRDHVVFMVRPRPVKAITDAN